MTFRLAFPTLLLAALGTTDAGAASSEWHHVEGASVRIVTSGAPDKDGRLRGALEVKLEPGWKTYWRDPGDSGVPPTLTALPGADAPAIDIAFPAPQRFDDGYSLWAGYDHSVSLALTFILPAGKPAGRIAANAFLGVCETICIPLQAELSVNPAEDADDPEHAAIVSAAFDALPGEARAGFEATVVDAAPDALTVNVAAPGGETVDLFVAGTENFALGTPERIEDGTETRFKIPILNRPDGEKAEEAFYTLVSATGAVSGKLPLK